MCGNGAGARRANELSIAIADLGITPRQIADIIAMREAGSISAQGAEQLFGLACESADSAQELAARTSLIVSNDQGQLEAWVDAAIAANKQAADDVRAGKMAAIGRIVGAVLKQAGGSVDGKAAQAMIMKRIGSDA